MMYEPERLLEQPTSALERALLQEGRAYRAPARLRAQTLTALGLAGSAGLASGVIAWLSVKSWTTKFVLALSTATLITAIPLSYMLRRGEAPVPPAPPVAVGEPLPAPFAVTTPASPIAVLAPFPTGAIGPPAIPSPTPTRPSVPTSSALRAELAALDAVRSTLANSNPAGALSLLATYFRTFPRGRLHFEAEVLRIDTLAKAGRPNLAKRYAQEFLKQHPKSVFAARIQPYAEP